MAKLPDTGELRSLVEREARRLVPDPNEAEDLAQECLLALHARAHEIRDPSRAAAWCRTVLRNILRQRLRRRWYTEAVGVERLSEPGEDPWEAVDARIVLEGQVGRLAEPHGRTVRSFYFGGRSVASIAQDEGRPVGTIKRWLHEGREALRMSLTEVNPDAPLARVYASSWLDDAKRNVTQAAIEAGYRPELCELGEEEDLPTDAALYIFGQQVGSRPGLELLLYLRGKEAIAERPVVLFGPGRDSAVYAAWKAGADTYLTDPSSPEVAHFLRKLREAHEAGTLER